jgi:hypothetical protein
MRGFSIISLLTPPNGGQLPCAALNVTQFTLLQGKDTIAQLGSTFKVVTIRRRFHLLA